MKASDHTLLLTPHIVEKIWGGPRLAPIKAQKNAAAIGETWEISRLQDGPSFCQGKALDQLVTQEHLPYLVKLIDTSDHLSVQVHPNDQYAKEHNLGLGKSECWLVLEANEGAGIYLGFKSGVKKEDFYQAAIKAQDLSSYLNFFPVKRGDFFWVPAGAIHAIGAGVFLAEVQQSSGITYRVWDWNRVDSKGQARQLHIKEAFEVINFEEKFNQELIGGHKKNVLDQKQKLIQHPQFEVEIIPLKAKQTVVIEALAQRCCGLLNLGAGVELEQHSLISYQAALLKAGEKTQVQAQENYSYLLVVR